MANSNPSYIEISEDEELQQDQEAEMPINDDQHDQNEYEEDEEEENQVENDADYDAYIAEMLASNFNRNAAGISAQTESRGGEKRRRIGGPETPSLGGIGSAGGSQGSEWNRSEIGGLFCPICLDACTNDGDHRICCLPCGHVFGMSCITQWLQRRNSRKCPQCNQKYKMKDVRKLFVSQVVSVHEESQKRIRVLEDKCASLEEKVADYSKKEAESIKREVEQQLKVQQCIKVKHSDASRENILPAPPFFENNFSWQSWKHAFNSFKAFFDSGVRILRSTDELLPLCYNFRGYETFQGAQVFPETVKALSKFFDNYGARIGGACNLSFRSKNLAFRDLGLVLYGMDTTPYSDVTDHRLLCWRDAIRDAILLGLHVDFLLDTLKMRLVRAVFEVRVTCSAEVSAQFLKVEAVTHALRLKNQELESEYCRLRELLLEKGVTPDGVECVLEEAKGSSRNASFILYD